MIPRGVAKRYATALLGAANKANIAGDILEETQNLLTVFAESPSFKAFLLSPQTLTSDKKDLIDSTLKGRASDLFVRFLHLLIDKKRVFFVSEIAEAYKYLYEAQEGVIEAKVITAIPLDERLERMAIEKLESETKKKVRITPIVDDSIIGGMIIQMEDKIIDGSIRYSLEKLKRDLDEIRV